MRGQQTAVDALGHVNVVSRRPPGAVLALLGLNGDGLCWADGLAQLASNAALFSSGVPFPSTHNQRVCSSFFFVVFFSWSPNSPTFSMRVRHGTED